MLHCRSANERPSWICDWIGNIRSRRGEVDASYCGYKTAIDLPTVYRTNAFIRRALVRHNDLGAWAPTIVLVDTLKEPL